MGLSFAIIVYFAGWRLALRLWLLSGTIVVSCFLTGTAIFHIYRRRRQRSLDRDQPARQGSTDSEP
jgi:hypothetical protein